jgi:hypothetical protein
MVERFNQSLLTLEKDELQATRLAELLGATRARFKTLLADVQSLNDELWSEDQFRDELNKALTVIEDARMEYNKSMSRIDTLTGPRAGRCAAPAVIFEEAVRFQQPASRSVTGQGRFAVVSADRGDRRCYGVILIIVRAF